ncbi:MAG: hypothetical protein C0432_03735 [Candidatus Puniceispirillum sp.]|nr:hypothetical protein [Candidatus Pelagibacter sp.]MBA4283386.1 hypothetical protein [Candidatus Puniceispirillum sp.]
MTFNSESLRLLPLLMYILLSTHNNCIAGDNYGFYANLEDNEVIEKPFEFKPEHLEQNSIYQIQKDGEVLHKTALSSKKSRYPSFIVIEKKQETDTNTAQHENDDSIYVDISKRRSVEELFPQKKHKKRRLSVMNFISNFLFQTN